MNEHDNKSFAEDILEELGQRGFSYDALNDQEILDLYTSSKLPELSTSFKERALTRMQQAQVEREAQAKSEVPSSLLYEAKKKGLPLPVFADELRLSIDLVMKLEKRLLDDVPNKLIKTISDLLSLSLEQVDTYLAQEPPEMRIAASSTEGPTGYTTESWQTAVKNSDLSSEDKAFWLKETE